jgi:outer membrane protein assembly factor BamB
LHASAHAQNPSWIGPRFRRDTFGIVRAVFFLLFLIAAPPARAEWPQFRGPEGTGISPARNLPLTWSESRNVRWKTAIHGRAWSSPVVLGNQVWVTSATEDGHQLFAVGLDRETGRIIHDLKVFHVDKPQYAHPFNTYASPTPVIEPGRLYVTFGSPGTAAIDTGTGKVVWERRDIECNHYRGAGSSPIIFGDLLIMHFDGSDHQFVVALDKRTGQTVWRTERSIDFRDLGADGKPQAEGDYRKAFATPHVVTVGGRPMLISIGSMATYGYDPLTGAERWRVEERGSFSGSTRPVVGHGLVFYPTGFPTGELLAVRPDGRGDVTGTHVVWRAGRSVPKKPSLLLVGDLIFTVGDSGVASCLEARTGALVWSARLGGNYSASPVWADGRIYVLGEEGNAAVIDAGRRFRLLAENRLDEGFLASPAVAGKALFLRSRTHLYRIEEPAGARRPRGRKVIGDTPQ